MPEDDLEDLLEEVKDIVSWENGGFKTDWRCYSFVHRQLVKEYRNAEKTLENLRQSRMQAFLKGWQGD